MIYILVDETVIFKRFNQTKSKRVFAIADVSQCDLRVHRPQAMNLQLKFAASPPPLLHAGFCLYLLLGKSFSV